MSTSASDIIDAIDAAILAWAGDPVSINFKGRVITYRSLDELTRARAVYQKLAASSAKSDRFQLRKITAGGE